LFSLDAGNPAAAIEALQIASRYDLALGRIGFVGRYGALYPIYVRGLAYLAAGQPARAEGEFQRIVEHPHITLVDPMSGLARLQLARALVLAGETVKATKAYDDLFILWKDADVDVPVIKQARAEFATLSRE
jgi:tetratricopeptide (TPR) repeat protein